MGSRDRPHREEQEEGQGRPSRSRACRRILEPPQTVEVIKPKRKPRTVVEDEDEG